jgi:hypothetical protein
MYTFVGKYFKSTQYSGRVDEVLSPMLFKCTLFEMPRYKKKDVVNIPVDLLLGFDWFNTEEEFIRACSSKKDYMPTPSDISFLKASRSI